jgi:hypothetical protein
MAKRNRENAVLDKRIRKQARKTARKAEAAAAAAAGDAPATDEFAEFDETAEPADAPVEGDQR